MKKEYAVCSLDCPDTCRLEIELDDNNVIHKITGDKNHPITDGFICNKVRQLSLRVYNKDRIKTPLKRIGKKGEGNFIEISWDEALDEIHKNFMLCIDKFGSESILPYSFAGTMGLINYGSMDRRFFNKLGTSKLERTICSTAGQAGYVLTMGDNIGVDPEDTYLAEYIVIWGTNLISTNIHQWKLFEKARTNGAKIIVIDVHKNRTAKLADKFIHINPGTDGALALGMANIMLNNNLADIDFIEQNTEGFEKFKEIVQEYEPQYVSSITGIPAEEIINFALEYGKNKKSFIRIGNGFQHHLNGGMATSIITCLPAITGAWRYKGCGATKSNSGYFKFNKAKLELPELNEKKSRTINMNQLGYALTSVDNPRIHALYVYNSNPAVMAPDQNKIIEGLKREDLFTVVHDIFITDTARYADIVLPAPTNLEYIDVYRSYWHLYLQLSEPIIPLQGQCLHNTEVFRRLAKKFDFNEECFHDTDEKLIEQAIDNIFDNISGENLFEILKKDKYIKVANNISFMGNKFNTPSGKIEFAFKESEDKGWNHIPTYSGIKSLTNDNIDKYPLILVNPPNHMFLNSTFGNIEKLQQYEVEPILEINPHDAYKRNIANNSLINIFNARGRCRLKCKITNNVLPNTVVSLGVWWNEFYNTYGNLNQLVSNELSDIGNGAIFFSTFVEIEKAKAIIIVGHGSSSPEFAKELEQLVQLISVNLREYKIVSAYLQINKPHLDDKVKELYEEGYNEIIILPLFVFAGKHVTKQIPELVNNYKQKYKNLDIILTKHIGPDNKLKTIIIDRIKENLRQ